MSTFDLKVEAREKDDSSLQGPEGLGSVFLLNNARWFTGVRWIVVAVFVVTGLAARLLPGLFISAGVVPPTVWPWPFAGLIALTNVSFAIHVGRFNDESPARPVAVNMWMQIISDLVFVTVLVHIVGSTYTVIPFTYLFHIVLACIFLPVIQSFLVTLIAACFYILCVTLELYSILPPVPFLIGAPHVGQQGTWMSFAFALSSVLIWAVVWYFVSTLSKTLRIREHQLSMANQRLIELDREKNREVLRTAHDLKAPFSGIESNIQVLQLQYWDDITEPVGEIINRIRARSAALSERIRDILVLGNLNARSIKDNEPVAVDLEPVFAAVTEDVEEKAGERKIALKIDVAPVSVLGDAKQLTILFTNLIANAINYSEDGGQVEVKTREDEGRVVITVADNGIGIADEALPHIFEEYYRSKEGARHSKISTGLGLAIVRRIALNLDYRVKIDSEVGKGTTFEVNMPKAAE